MNLRDLLLRVRALAAPRRVERELDEELAFHLERETQRQIANGLSPADARDAALARFGPVALAADPRPAPPGAPRAPAPGGPPRRSGSPRPRHRLRRRLDARHSLRASLVSPGAARRSHHR